MSEIVLEDLLLRDWPDELLRYANDMGGPVHVVDGDGELPAQAWTDPQGEPRVCFIASLGALECRKLTVAPGAAPTSTDLEVVAAGDRVWLRTSRFGIQLPLGEFAGAELPPPVLAMRWADGSVFGGGRWFGETPERLEARLTGAGPVFADMRLSWTWADGATGSLRVELAAGDCQAYWESHGSADRPDRGWDLSLAGLGPLVLHAIQGKKWKESWGLKRGEVGDVTLDDKWTGMLTTLSPWRDWWDDQAQTSWQFKTADRGFVMQAASCHEGDWVDPDPPGTFASWDKRLHKHLGLHRGADGDIFLHIDMAAGWRKWCFGAHGRPIGRHLDEVKDMVLDWPDRRQRPFLYVTAEDIAKRRRPVKDPEVQALLAHADEDLDAPYAYGEGPGNDHLQNTGDDQAIAAWLLTGSAEVAARTHLVERLRRRLNWLGDFDLMRYVTKVVLFFDLVSHSELVDPAERRVFRAQLAYLGYRLANPRTWSMERGYRSGAPNMTISYTLNLGTVAAAIPEHPQAAAWAGYATARYRQWMAEKVGTKGEWPESMHYIHVSTSEFLNYAIAARNAGLADLLAEGTIKRVLLYAAKMHAPPDRRGEPPGDPIHNGARHRGVRGMSPLGRAASTGCSYGHYGLLARATRDSDPAFSRVMQWLYRESGWNEVYGNSSLSPLRLVYWDRGLPAERPDWHSEAFNTAIVLRDRVGEPDEDHLVFDAGALFTSPGEHGGLNLWFWQGVPLVSRFSGGYDERAEALISNLSRAIPRGPDRPETWSDTGDSRATAFAHLEACDYAVIEGARGPAHTQLHAYPPGFPGLGGTGEPASADAALLGIMRWRRQVLHVRDPDGAFLLLRDHAGNEPGLWKLWTLSTAIAAIDGRKLPDGELTGDAFTAVGQFGVDLDILLATPANTPREALHYRREYDYVKKLLKGFVDDQRLLAVGVPAGQACFAALVPRQADDAPADCEALAGGRVIRLRRADREYLCVLADEEAEVRAGDLYCRAPAAVLRVDRTAADDPDGDDRVRHRSAQWNDQSPPGGRLPHLAPAPDALASVLAIILPGGGELAFGDYAVATAGPAEVAFGADSIRVCVPYRKACNRLICLRMPGDWELRVPSASAIDPKLLRTAEGWQVELVPEVRREITLHRR